MDAPSGAAIRRRFFLIRRASGSSQEREFPQLENLW